MLRGVAIAAVMAMAAALHAAPARVAVVHANHPDLLEQRTVTRLRAELAVAGFEVTEMVRGAGDAREAAEAEPPVPGVFATIVVVPRTPDTADIWVADRITGKTVVRRVRVDADARSDVAAILAVRAVELVQASLLEAIEPPVHEQRPSSPPLPSDVSEWMDGRRPRAESSLSLEAGLGVLHSFGGVGPALVPVLGVSYAWTIELSLGLRAGATAFASNLDATVGSLAVRQELISLDLVYRPPLTTGRIRPVAILGAGAYHLGVVGTARAPYEGRTAGLFAAMVDVGLGATFSLGRRVSLVVDVRALIVVPKPIVRAAGEQIGSISQPSPLSEATLDVGF